MTHKLRQHPIPQPPAPEPPPSPKTTIVAYQAQTDIDTADVSRPHFALPSLPKPGDAPLLPWGIDWKGPWEEAQDGSGEATRLHASALHHEGVPVRLVASGLLAPTTDGGAQIRTDSLLDEAVLAEVGELRHTRFERCAAIVSHMVPTTARLRDTLYPSQSHVHDAEGAESLHRFRVLMSVWERDRVPFGQRPLLQRFGQHWVPCERNRQLIIHAGVEPDRVLRIPHPTAAYSPLPAIGAAKKWGSSEPCRFYSIGKWEPRKNHHALIGAFLLAFKPGDMALLAIKTSKFIKADGYPHSPEESVREHLARPEVRAQGWTAASAQKHLHLVVDKIPHADILRWHQAGHVYATASHGEAFDMPAFDAVLARSRLIHVGFGGSEDWAPHGSLRAWSEAIDGLDPCHSSYGWGIAQWAKVSERAVAAAMQTAAIDHLLGTGLERPDDFSPATVGAQMRAGLERLWDGEKDGPKWGREPTTGGRTGGNLATLPERSRLRADPQRLQFHGHHPGGGGGAERARGQGGLRAHRQRHGRGA